MRALNPLTLALLFVSLVACGDDNSTSTGSDSTTADAVASSDTGGPVSDDDASPASADTSEADGAGVGVDADADAPEACQHPCLNDFDQSDKKLCPDPKSDWTCEEGCCLPVFRCEVDADCTTQGFDEGQCTDPALPCVCEGETGACYSVTCSTSAQCAEELLCAAGVCVDAPAEGDVLLRIVSRQTALVPGATAPLLIDGYIAENADVRFPVEVTWASDDDAVMTVNSDGVATGGADAGDAVLTATHAGGASASITLRNVTPSPEDTLTVIALREGTLQPAEGHFAMVDTASGEVVASGPLPESGVMSTAHAATDGLDVHIFAAEHDWISHLNVTGATLFVPLTPTMWGAISMSQEGELEEDTELVGATVIEGTVDMGAYEKAGEVELTLSALPFGATLFDFNLDSILGASVKRFFHPDTALPGVDTTETLEMPGGLTFAFAGPAVPTYVLAVPPGTSTVWTLGGRIGIDEVFAFSDDIFEAFDGGSVNFGQIASYLMPFFTEFWSGLSKTPALSLDGNTLHTVNTTLETPMALNMEIEVPTLPSLGQLGWAATVFAIGGAMTGDELFYPLGLAAAGDTSDETKWPADGEIDGIEETPEPDPLALSLAPLYGELGGPHSSYTTALVALSIRDGGSDPRPEGGSAIFAREPAGAAHTTSFPDTSFLAFSLASSWDAEARAVTAESVPDAETVRLLFKGATGSNWTLWLNGNATYTVPTPSALVPEMAEDRAADPATILISQFDFSSEITLELLREPGTPTIQELLHQVDRTSFVEL
jgi:hypothetical protein